MIEKQLTYLGKVTIERGELLGPDLKGRKWIVTGSEYNADRDQTFVNVYLPEKKEEAGA